MPSTTQPATTGTPISASNSALHWAGVAYGFAEAREQQGKFLTPVEQEYYNRHLSAARAQGFTEEQVRDYAAALARTSV